MPTTRPFAYNTGTTIGGTTQFGNLAIGNSQVDYSLDYGGVKWWMGPDESLGYVIAVPVPSGTQPIPIAGTGAKVGFYGTEIMSYPFGEFTFVLLVNQTFNQSFTNGDDASNWLTSNGYWNSWGIVTPGLIIELDAYSSVSYPGSGTSVYNLINVGT